jgi:hypothetical protein
MWNLKQETTDFTGDIKLFPSDITRMTEKTIWLIEIYIYICMHLTNVIVPIAMSRSYRPRVYFWEVSRLYRSQTPLKYCSSWL